MRFLKWFLIVWGLAVVLSLATYWHEERVIDARVEWVESMHQAEMEMNRLKFEAFLQSKTYQGMKYQKMRRSY